MFDDALRPVWHLVLNSQADSAGILVFRPRPGGPEFLLARAGGPFWRGKDARAWSFPKGRIEVGETPIEAARREFREETGLAAPETMAALTPLRRKGRGQVYCWLAQADLDLTAAHSNALDLGGHEVEAYAYCDRQAALRRIHESLEPILIEAFDLLQAAP